jgi:DNA-directed RNA polymerase subunit RPC12/RpoP
VSDTIKCACLQCGAKYRLPVEAQGRTARCKRCGKSFQVPRQMNLEDTIQSWLAGPADEEEEEVAQPRVISMPDEPVSDEAAKKIRGPIRMKSDTASTNVKK